MEAFKKRLIEEQKDLQEKTEVLQKAFDSGDLEKLSLAQKYLLKDQLKHMIAYNEILLARLSIID